MVNSKQDEVFRLVKKIGDLQAIVQNTRTGDFELWERSAPGRRLLKVKDLTPEEAASIINS
jgi:pyocin large subunit-like protein